MPDHAEEDELTLIENAPPSRPDARLSVPATAALLVADVVGTGVLALPRNVRAVGLPCDPALERLEREQEGEEDEPARMHT